METMDEPILVMMRGEVFAGITDVVHAFVPLSAGWNGGGSGTQSLVLKDAGVKVVTPSSAER